jgi:hypothetical protein
MMVKPVSLGFFGGMIKDCGTNRQGKFVREIDNATFDWDGIIAGWAPFRPHFIPGTGTVKDGGLPAYVNEIAIPGAPHNVPGARNTVWGSGPTLAIYGTIVPNYQSTVSWLVPLSLGEVIWVGMPGGGGWVSTVPINHQPSIAMDKRGDDFRGNPLWVSASLNGKKAIIRDDRGYFYELDITVNKVENVQNTSTDSTERYDISAQIQRKDNPLVIGDSENFNSDAWIIKDDVPVAFNMAQGQYETTSLSYVEVGSFNGHSYGYAWQKYRQVAHVGSFTHTRYIESYASEYSGMVSGVGGFLCDINPANDPSLNGEKINAMFNAVWAAMPTEVVRCEVAGVDIGYELATYPGFSSSRISVYKNLAQILLFDTSGNPHYVYWDMVNDRPFSEDHIVRKNAAATFVRALSPDRIYLSDDSNDMSCWFV